MSCIVYQTNKKTGITYAYESVSYWDKEKQQPRSKRQYIGRVDDETGKIIPKQGKKSKSQAKEVSSNELDNLLSEMKEKNKLIEALSADNKRLKTELDATYQTISKIKGLCEELV